MPLHSKSSEPRPNKSAARESLDIIEGFYQGQEITGGEWSSVWRNHWIVKDAVKHLKAGEASVFEQSLLLGVQSIVKGEPFSAPSKKEDIALDQTLFIN